MPVEERENMKADLLRQAENRILARLNEELLAEGIIDEEIFAKVNKLQKKKIDGSCSD